MERFAWFADNTGAAERGTVNARVHAVVTKGANPWGLYDVHGNVWEWTLDAYAPYAIRARARARARDGLRKKPVGDVSRVFRGGGFNDSGRLARSAFRLRGDPHVGYHFVGFRPARAIR
ncbi:MAG: SUMF1/EgtB/PvdO family nonheme iron enzyme [Myxococcota bacterium]